MNPQYAIFRELYRYDDYRKFLEDFFKEQKERRAVFSHRFFARKAGFTSSSFCLSVIKGRFNLSPTALDKLVRAMELDDRQARYFKNLVDFNQAKQAKAREDAWNQLQELRREVEFTSLAEPQQGYFSHWWFPVLRELATHPNWKGDYRQLARWIDPGIGTEEVRSAVEKMLEWGILLPGAGGRLRASSLLINAEGVPPIALRQIKRELLQNGIAALDTKPPSQRFATFSTLAMSEDSYEYALKVLEEARSRIIARAASDVNVEKIYEMVLQVFPLTHDLRKEPA